MIDWGDVGHFRLGLHRGHEAAQVGQGIDAERQLVQQLVGALAGAATDVFEQEPYTGPLAQIDRCLLTSHMGSMSVDCRTRMEIEATEEAIRFLTGQPLQGVVPPEEYDVQRQGL